MQAAKRTALLNTLARLGNIEIKIMAPDNNFLRHHYGPTLATHRQVSCQP